MAINSGPPSRASAGASNQGSDQTPDPALDAALRGARQVGRARRHSLPLSWIEPLDAYKALRAAGHQVLMLDGMGDHPDSNRAILATTPLLEVRVEGGSVVERWRNGQVRRPTATPAGYLADLAADWCRGDMEPGFTAGFVGYLGYEFAHHLDDRMPGPRGGADAGSNASGHDDGVPDAVLRLCLDAIVFDRRTHTAIVHATDVRPPGSAPEGVLKGLRRAADRAGALLRGAQQAPPPVADPQAGTHWATSMDQGSFEAAVLRVKKHIAEGDLFQANIATRFTTDCRADPAALFARLQAANPSPYMALLDFGDHAVISGSPEQLFIVQPSEDGPVITSRPIAGTRPRGAEPNVDEALERELLADPKERAEHTMLVDLVRNDVARVSVPGTTRVAEAFSVERYRHVMHLVSSVTGRVRPETGFVDWLTALFPGGTITGAPKLRAMQRIHEAEPVPRGPYTGSAGYLSLSGSAAWNILIRTLVLSGGKAHVLAGSGIVADSDPTREWIEAGNKAQALLEAASGDTGGGSRARLGEVTRHGAWSPPTPPRQVAARVLVIDNEDSFVYNLADYAAALGADVRVLRNDSDWRAAVDDFDPTHLIVSPGPGRPEDAGCSIEAIRSLSGRLPILGVCLGHQAIAAAFGARVIQHQPVHGKTDTILHDGRGPLAAAPSPWTATRYHSLIVAADGFPGELEVAACLGDGTIMAIRHRNHPTLGLQVHPESLSTARGLEIVLAFLETTS